MMLAAGVREGWQDRGQFVRNINIQGVYSNSYIASIMVPYKGGSPLKIQKT